MEWLKVPEIAKLSGVPENTCRRYMDTFAQYFKSRKFGRVTKYSPDAVDLVKKIALYYHTYSTTTEVQERLSEEMPLTIELDSLTTMPPPQKSHVLEVIGGIMVRQKEQGNLLKEIIQRIERQEAAAEERHKERNKKLDEFISEWRESKKKRPWWTKLFKST